MHHYVQQHEIFPPSDNNNKKKGTAVIPNRNHQRERLKTGQELFIQWHKEVMLLESSGYTLEGRLRRS